MREQIEVLEHQAKTALDLPKLLLGGIFRMAVFRFRRRFAQIDEVAIVHGFQHSGTAQQGGFTGAGGANDRNDLALLHVQRNIVEHVRLAERLFAVIDFKQFHRKHPLTDSSSSSFQFYP